MKQFLVLIPFFFCFLNLSYSQQIVIPIQFQSNLGNTNPAYVGINDALTLSSLINNRSSSIYNTSYKSFQANLPFRFYSMGLGVSAVQQKVGINELSTFKLAYSYKIRAFEGILSFGTSLGINQFRQSLDNQTIQSSTDPTLIENATTIKPLLNTGLFYQNKLISISLAIDNLFKNNLSFNAESSQSESSRNIYSFIETRHKLSEKLTLKPSIQLHKTKQAPINLSTSILLDMNNKLWSSIGYNVKSELFFTGGINLERLISGFSQPIKLGLAYSIPQNNGIALNNSVEIFLSYSYNKRPNPEKIKNQKRIISPIIFY